MTFKNMFFLQEPQWLVQAMINLNSFVVSDPILRVITPLFADIFVFFYPVFLIIFYVMGILKKEINHKLGTLYIFFSALVTIATNLGIQYFVDKARPETAIINKANLILQHIPSKSFPSDHAGITAAIAMATMLWAYKTKNSFLKKISYVLWVFCILTSVARVAVGVHWPTDVIFGIIVGILISLILVQKDIFKVMSKVVYKPLIDLEVYIAKIIIKKR